jgi:hypothetical protein
MRHRIALVLLGVAFLGACKGTSTIEGDLSIGVTKGAYRTVSLVRNSADSLLAKVDANCAAEHAEVQRLTDGVQANRAAVDRFNRTPARTAIQQVALGDSAQKYRQAASEMQRALSDRPDTVYLKNVALVRAATDTSVEVDAEGHFRFAKRPRGTYLLYAEWISPKGDNEFLAPVDASGGGKKTQNLDQSAVSKRLRCR